MKDNFEKEFSELINGYEIPYDPSAWADLNKRLNQTQPVRANAKGKWFLGGATAVALIVSIALLTKENTAADSLKKKENEQVASTVEERNTPTENVIESSKLNSSKVKQNTEVTQTEKEIETVSNDQEPTKSASHSETSNNQKLEIKEVNIPIVKENISYSNGNLAKGWKAPTVHAVCSGETLPISNENDSDVIVVDVYGSKTIVRANKTVKYNASQEGKHRVGYYENGNFNELVSFTVHSNPKADFSIDDQLIYEDGLPTTILSTSANGTNFSWESEGQKSSFTGRTARMHFFNAGDYSTTLTVTGSNGCKSTISKQVRITDDYNLLAVTAFDPLSNDNRKNSFMPYALTQRPVDFNMIIIDPKDGAVIFESNDATNSWKGIDKRSGQMIDASKPYIWRVILKNPELGEKSEYKGTIVRM